MSIVELSAGLLDHSHHVIETPSRFGLNHRRPGFLFSGSAFANGIVAREPDTVMGAIHVVADVFFDLPGVLGIRTAYRFSLAHVVIDFALRERTVGGNQMVCGNDEGVGVIVVLDVNLATAVAVGVHGLIGVKLGFWGRDGGKQSVDGSFGAERAAHQVLAKDAAVVGLNGLHAVLVVVLRLFLLLTNRLNVLSGSERALLLEFFNHPDVDRFTNVHGCLPSMSRGVATPAECSLSHYVLLVVPQRIAQPAHVIAFELH